MMNNYATMNEDMILEIISHCPPTDIARFRSLNKECNKRSYGFNFLNRHLERTNSVFGYFIQYNNRYNNRYISQFISGVNEEAPPHISLDFLPSKDVKIAACDTHNGVLLCIDESKYRRGLRRSIPEYIVCKPATKQYQIIPNPRTRFFTLATGFMVVQSNPFRYKIVRVSQPSNIDRRKAKEGFYISNCEVFESQLSKWKRLKDLELPRGEFLKTSDKPVSVYGFLHWLTSKYVIRFCMRTETWSNFPVPDHLVGRKLVSYEGKLGLVGLRWKKEYDLWVLENSSGKSWIVVKDVKSTGLQNDKDDELLWFPSNDVVSTAGEGRLGLYNMNSSNIRYIHKEIEPFSCTRSSARESCVPFYSNYDRVDLNEDRVRRSNRKRKDCKGRTSYVVVVVTKWLIVMFFISSILGYRLSW